MRNRGFTLLELIVASAIFAIVVSAAYALFTSSRSLASRAEGRALEFQTARAALAAIEADVRGTVASGTVYDLGFIGTDVGSLAAPLDELQILTVGVHPGVTDNDDHRNDLLERRSDLSRVTYWIDPERGLVRRRETVLSAPIRNEDDVEGVEVVARDVAFLDFRYYDLEWQTSWDSTTQLSVPSAVEISVGLRDGARFTSRVYLPVAAGTPAEGEQEP